jgi:DNA-directed RNA polymerase specialized sigma24 family protein
MSEPEAGSAPAQHGEWDHRVEPGMAHDAEMMERVRAAGPDGVLAQYLRERLLEDACGELMKLHLIKRLLPRVESQACTRLPAPPDDWQDSAEGLIYVSVRQSLDTFVKNAVFGAGPCRWRPDGGASVRTYFVNKALLTFKDLYLEEHRKRGSAEIPYADIAVEEDDTVRVSLYPATSEDPESRAVHLDLIRRMGQKMTEVEARIVLGKSVGKTNEEIGRDLSMSDDAVGSKLYRLRRRIRG